MPSGPRIRANNVYGLLSDNPLTSGATSMNSAGLVTLPIVSSAHAVIVLDPKRVFGEPEIVVVTAHSLFSTTATIVRGQYGTFARAHPTNTSWAHVPINEDFISVVTSSTHPTNPYEGQFIYETDTNEALVYNGASWVEFGGGGGTDIFQQTTEPPAVLDNLWLDTDEGSGVGLSSIIGYTENTALNQTGITAQVAVTGLSVTVSVPDGRRLRITGKLHVNNTNAPADRHLIQIVEGATQLQGGYGSIENNGLGEDFTVQTIVSPSAGSHTYFLTLGRANGDGTVTAFGDATLPAFILVEDITGTLWPAGATIGAGTIASEAWTNWVPVWTNLTVGSGTVTARYIKIGRTVHYRLRLVLNSTTVGSDVSFSLPITAATYATTAPIGLVDFQDSGTVDVSGVVWSSSATTGRLIVYGTGGAFPNSLVISSTVPFTWANTDEINVTGTYEAAS